MEEEDRLGETAALQRNAGLSGASALETFMRLRMKISVSEGGSKEM